MVYIVLVARFMYYLVLKFLFNWKLNMAEEVAAFLESKLNSQNDLLEETNAMDQMTSTNNQPSDNPEELHIKYK